MLERLVKKILASRVYDVAIESPLQKAPGLTRRLGNHIWLKREDLQPVFSFKLRGSYNKIAGLTPEERAGGVVCASAGNHAQGVALAAAKLGIRAHVVMGRNAPSIKIEAVKNRGAHVILRGDSYDEAAAYAIELADKEGYAFVHPFDDIDVIAGQGTVGMEIVNQHPGELDAIFVPVGGGGLIAGVAAYVKYLHPRTRIIGVEAEGSACLKAALKAGRRVKLKYEELDLFADGVSVAQVGAENFKIARKYVDDVVTASVDEICAAIKDTFEDTRSIAEPAGALAVAGMKKYLADHEWSDRQCVAVISGANVNFDRLRHIAERAEVGEQREAILAVTIDEKPGSFRQFCKTLGKRAVTEFNYRYSSGEAASVYVGVQIAAAGDRAALLEELGAKGYAAQDMTDNETAKLHVRHMVGGHAPSGINELLFRFEFPERPGALIKFLSGLGARWNITVFHYRNHGSAWGRVLVGFQASAAERTQLLEYLQRIGYRYWEETDNPAYNLFLG